MRILTLNTGLLGFLGGRVEGVPHLKARSQALTEQLLSMDADLILLQEVYLLEHRRRFVAELSEVYPWAAYRNRRHWIRFESSLMAFSRVPMEAVLHPFRTAPRHEKVFDPKGYLVCRISSEQSGPLTVFNVHTTAGGLWSHPEHARIESIRSKQLAEMLGAADQESGTTILAGDFNAGPGVSLDNFTSMEKAGFVSVHDHMHGTPSDVTWDPANRLNKDGPHRMCPRQRIDHIFVRRSDINSRMVVPTRSGVCLDAETVVLSGREACTVSDHAGFYADLQFLLRYQSRNADPEPY